MPDGKEFLQLFNADEVLGTHRAVGPWTFRSMTLAKKAHGVAENLKVNDVIALTFAGMNAIAGKIVRDGGDSFGVWFTPSRLRPEELRDLVTTPQRAV